MCELTQSLADLNRNRDRLEELIRAARHTHTRHSDASATGFDEDHGFGSNPGNLRMFSYVPLTARGQSSPRRYTPRMRTNRGRLQSWGRMVDACRPLRLRPAASRAAAVQQPQRLLQLVRRRRYPAG